MTLVSCSLRDGCRRPQPRREEMGMAEIDQRTFQDTVNQYLIRHRSILDVQSKLSEAAARVNRAIAKSVTNCGCISIDASRQRFPVELSLAEIREMMQTHVNG